ncbi:MAG: YggT family protein [Pyrinomonadaceae bacterium]|nr:YggT family protein [Pyrinomonadaceae bacterium]
MINVLAAIYLFIKYLIVIAIIFVIALMLVRLIMNSMDVNPFTWVAITIRRLSDPLVNPVRRALMGFGAQAKYAPLVTILLAILLGYFAFMLATGVLNTLTGVLLAATSGAIIAVIGYLLYGLLALYSLLIFIRIIFSWGQVSHRNRLMRFLVNATDPLLVPLRRMIPPLGVFDISPIVAFIIIWLFQAAVAGTLLRGARLSFFG